VAAKFLKKYGRGQTFMEMYH